MRFVPNEAVDCGTFFAKNDYFGQSSCNRVMIGPNTLTDAQQIAQGYTANRSGDKVPANAGQFGVGLTAKSSDLKTDFSAYFANVDNTSPVVSVFKSTRTNPFLPLNPDGKNGSYFMTWPENVQSLALNFNTRLTDLKFFGQLVYQPNAIFRINGSDLLNAAASNTAASLIRQTYNSVPLGGIYDGYDRHQIYQMSLGAEKAFREVLGADMMIIGGEFGAKYVPDLPDVNQVRYGRSDVFGIGPVSGFACNSGTGCSNDGYVTSTAYGYRLRVALLYPNVFSNVDILPSITFGHDLSGYDNEEVFFEGRQFLRLSLRGEYRKKYYMELLYAPQWGGNFNLNNDQSYASLTLGMKF
ncbi:MAG: DUF1302 family protein [Deltaproteobacteria bacterium]|nr:DUF1302 family protein [Deltaproteobacteria bacterium]